MEVAQEVIEVIGIRHHNRLVGVLAVDGLHFKWLRLLGHHLVQGLVRPLVLAVVVVATLKILLALLELLVRVFLLSIIAENGLINHGMEDLLFPTVVLAAVGLKLAAFLILAYEISSLPLLTNFERVVLEEVGLSSEVLPVVSVHALSLVVFCVVGTPFGLEVEHVKFLVPGHLVDQRCLYVLITMRE